MEEIVSSEEIECLREHNFHQNHKIDFIARDLPDIPASRYQFEENTMHLAVGSQVQINSLHSFPVCNSTAGLSKRDQNPTQPAPKKSHTMAQVVEVDRPVNNHFLLVIPFKIVF